MSCKYCSDKYDEHRTGKFKYKRGDDFFNEVGNFDAHIEITCDKAYMTIYNYSSEETDCFNVNYCLNCGERLK